FGIFPSWGLSQKLPRLIGVNRAREVSLTAEPVSADKAERWGLLSRVVEADQLVPTAITIAKTVAANHPDMVLRYKAVINDGIGLSLSDGRRLETGSQGRQTPDVIESSAWGSFQIEVADVVFGLVWIHDLKIEVKD
ncbi:unnamed protein product, partial [Closterium sp. NIES-54]